MAAVVVNRTDFYNISTVDLIFGYKILQYSWFLFSSQYVGLFNLRIVYFIRRHKQLTTPANIIIGGILICDIVIVFLYCLTGTLVTFETKLWLTEGLCRLMSFFIYVSEWLTEMLPCCWIGRKIVLFYFCVQAPQCIQQ